jgi:hypothetical protein
VGQEKSMSSRIESRRHPRFRISLPCAILRRGIVEPVRMVDASYRGILLAIPEALPERSLQKLRMGLPTGDLIMHAVVIHNVAIGGVPHVGMRFFALSGEPQRAWESLIATVGNSLREAATKAA